jgi:Lrp/AsnC family transcriptional regulator, leucine-responsive regulatory protein
MIDDIDRQILDILQTDARLPNAEIARRVGMAPSATLDRLRKLEERGVIRGYELRVDPAAVGLPLLAFVLVRAEERPFDPETGRAIAAVSGVQEVHHIAGEDCYLVKVRAESPEALGLLLRDAFGTIPTVRSTRTTVVLGTLRETTSLPVALADASER